jgi:hypothetical protein
MTAQTPPKSVMLPGSPRYGYTYHRPDGNRIVAGKGSLPDTVPIEVQLGFVPVWVVAVPLEGGSIWAAVSAEAEVVAFLVEAEGVTEVPINVGNYVGGQPPLLEVGQDGVSIVSVASNSGSLFTHPVVLWESGSRVWIDEDGYLHLHEGNQDHKLDIPVLPDARIAQDERERLLLLSNPTKAYDHGVLGDDLEAGGVILVETEPEFRVAEHFMVPGGLVIEGIVPIWVDLDGDGSREIILTASDRINGARLLVYSEDGVLVAESDPIGRGYRWLHQLAVASPEVGILKKS